MKKNIILFSVISVLQKVLKSINAKRAFFLLLLLAACKNEDSVDPDKPSSFFQYEGVTYPLENGWIKNVDNVEWGLKYTTISLYSSGVSWDDALEEFTGKGHSIHILFRRSGEELIGGTYNYQDSTEGPYSLTVSIASFSMDWNWENSTGVYGYFREGSVVEVAEQDGQYSLVFTLKPTLTLGNITSDSPVTGVFNGRLTVLD